MWLGTLGPWPMLVSPVEPSQCRPARGACRSQLAAPVSCLAGSWNQLWGEFTQWGKRDKSQCSSSEHSTVRKEIWLWFQAHWWVVVGTSFADFVCYRMLTFLLGFNAQVPPYVRMEDLLQAPARVENGSSCGTLERSLGNLEALPGNQSWLLFWFMAFWTYCLDTLPPLTFYLMPRFHNKPDIWEGGRYWKAQ